MRGNSTAMALRIGAVLAAGAVAAAPPAAAESDLSQDQWGLQAVDAAGAWEHSRGSGVTVAVLSTGVDAAHPDLGSAADDGSEPAVSHGGDLTGEELDPADESFGIRGTRLAGIVAARGHGREHAGGTMGVAPEARVYSLRVSAEDAGPEAAAVASGLRSAVQDGAQVALLPAGSDAESEELASAVSYAHERGVVVVAPAERGPAFGEAVAVGSVDSEFALTGEASEEAVLSAPGADIVTTAAGGGYTRAEGPAAAAAFVAGTAALVRSAYPQLRPEHVVDALRAGAQPPEQAQPGHGAGVVNAAETLQAAELLAEDVEPFDESLTAQAGERGTAWWGFTAGGAALAAAAVAAVIVLRRRWANPYGLGAVTAPSGRRGAGRRGRRGRARNGRRS